MSYFQRARDEAVREPNPDIELTSMIESRNGDDRRKAARCVADAAWKRLRDVLGAHHPSTLQAEFIRAIFSREAREALQRITLVCRAFREFHPKLIEPHLQCERARAVFATEAEESRSR